MLIWTLNSLSIETLTSYVKSVGYKKEKRRSLQDDKGGETEGKRQRDAVADDDQREREDDFISVTTGEKSAIVSLSDKHSNLTNNPNKLPSDTNNFTHNITHLDYDSYIEFNPFYLKFNKEDIYSIDFNCWSFNEDELVLITYIILDEMKLISTFNININILQNFILNVRARYRDNPYHCFYHGFSVLQFSFLTICNTFLKSLLSPLEHLSLLLSALCHDIDHPGTTNSFQINCASFLALAHNDQSVLENHHAYTLFFMLQDPNINILDPLVTNLSSEQIRMLRKSIILSILHTDMAHHFDTCKKLDQLTTDSILSMEKEEDKQFIINLITHAADLSGQVYPLNIALEWEARVSEEFLLQADIERELGLPVAPFMQNLDNSSVRLKNHIFFLDFVMQPLWRSMADLFSPLKPCLDNMFSNRRYFADCYDQSKFLEEANSLNTTNMNVSHMNNIHNRDNLYVSNNNSANNLANNSYSNLNSNSIVSIPLTPLVTQALPQSIPHPNQSNSPSSSVFPNAPLSNPN
jgi:hypothetical protein